MEASQLIEGKKNAFAKFHKNMANRTRNRRFSNSQVKQAFVLKERYVSSLLDSIKPRIKEAENFKNNIEIRKSEGKLDEYSAQIESLIPQVVLSMHNSLEKLYRHAVNAEDHFVLSRVGVALGSLENRLEDGLVRERNYPKNHEERNAVVRRVVNNAQDTYTSLVQMLDTAPQECNIILPLFPRVPTLH